jgi:chromosome segregation ATPase
MTMTQKIPYNKKDKGSKILGRGGPRDLQRRQQMGGAYGSADINMPKVDIEELKKVLLNNQQTREELKQALKEDIDSVGRTVEDKVKQTLREEAKHFEGGLPFDVVQQKIEEAVRHTQEVEAKRYESGLGNLNSQLNQAKEKIKELEREIIDKNRHVTELRMQVGKLEKQLDKKEEELKLVERQKSTEITKLQEKITELIEKITSGNISIGDVSTRDSHRPKLEDVFIDPLGELSTELDHHINIDVDEGPGSKRDLKSDVAKLKDLLKKKDYKPVKGSVGPK